ncbi:ABC transporter, permease protein [Campylobacter blaseri]|uniref:Molybdate ABC transporter permease subunit n=1 Tax=Campylobacter blaseri TaxID=2042961 RepID=A0A2P8R1D0_9BACT|nr:ABC transporter permease subunit [Campylobacter blaseri]PSM52300.1 molybdate ABC transporter permease subunit [Campylobacter blaseri]PSM54066.1 molybdate ABC transporter permease subunit [Campylobacter blaseri]QKF85507.1 ABC transporter, permease protein [Campylobacter blaseri]
MVYEPFILSAKILACCFFLFMIFGTYLANFLATTNSKLKWLVEALVTLPLIFPPVAIGFFLLILLGKNGFIGSFFANLNIYFIFEFKALVIAGFIAGIPLFVKPVQSAIELFPKNVKEASLISGKSEFKTLIFIVLPSIKKSIFQALIIALGRALGEVGISLMIGGNITHKTDTLSLAIYNAVFDGDYDLAMMLSLVLIIISTLLFIILNIINKKS